MFGRGASIVRSSSPRLDLWVKAFDDWLESIRVARGRTPRRQALRSWELLLHFHRCPPWDVDRSKLESWTAHLVKTGLSASTIRCYRGRISGFYRFCSKRPEFLSAEPLFGLLAKPFNPVHGATKPSDRNYQHAYLLRPAEARSLLRAVDRQSSLVGKRDYALLLTLFLTGLPEGELRLLRWKQVSQLTPLDVRFISAPGEPGKEIPPAAWSAILAYLESSGRSASIQPDDYIFAPLADPLLRPPSGQPGDWRSDRPLSTEQMYAFLKCYAAWAGLDASKVTYACLRHTAAALRLDAGADAAALQAFLGRRYLSETRRYIGHLGRMMGERKPRLVRLPPQADRGPYRRKKPYAQPGNQNALIHGYYARSLLEMGLQEIPAGEAVPLENEILGLRVMLRRAMHLASRADNLPVSLRVMEFFGRTALRLARLLLDQKKLGAGTMEAAFDQALAEVIVELGLVEQQR